MVDELKVFPHKHAWSVSLRRPLVTLPEKDAQLLHRRLAEMAQPVEEHRHNYLDQIKPVRAQGKRG